MSGSTLLMAASGNRIGRSNGLRLHGETERQSQGIPTLE